MPRSPFTRVAVVNERVKKKICDESASEDLGRHVRATLNNPEKRRNLILKALHRGGIKIVGARKEDSLLKASIAHSKGYLRFIEQAYNLWKTESLKDPGFLNDVQTGVVPFLFHRNIKKPRQDSFQALIAYYGADVDTPFFEDTAEVLKEDLGVVLKAVEHSIQEELSLTYALVTHPGHHAGPEYFCGYCYINSAMVAAKLFEKAGLRPAILDVDVHGGNGTFDFSIPRFISIHYPHYPWYNFEEYGRVVPGGMTWNDYSKVMEEALRCILKDADVLILSLGYDTLGTDPEAGNAPTKVPVNLKPEDFDNMRKLIERFGKRCLIVQEGGYDMDAVPVAASYFMGCKTEASKL